jgi:hypothetical protein
VALRRKRDEKNKQKTKRSLVQSPARGCLLKNPIRSLDLKLSFRNIVATTFFFANNFPYIIFRKSIDGESIISLGLPQKGLSNLDSQGPFFVHFFRGIFLGNYAVKFRGKIGTKTPGGTIDSTDLV